ncbi:MAG: ADP-forming succinate--CoA ligase subunit beta [Anaerolineae bacterium]|nr:ADP-forming succinate--CoA ligase subunit beta [Anaerolineae bacterium]NUQ03470.1 ADP-forming succinate--CoA ligase subunit beta [Anaerolineae bacterium]
MDLFEYQGKQYFARFDISVPTGDIARTVDEVVTLANSIGYPVVIKAQVQVGGRGKAGGIKIANNAEEARFHGGNILGMSIKGHVVHMVWVERASDIAEEYYVSFTLDRSAKQYLGMLSARGGIDIEQVAEQDPGAIQIIHINPVDGLTAETAHAWVAAAGLNPIAVDQTVTLVQKLYRAFTDGDADLVEINPMILSKDGRVYALDAKVSLDDSAAGRHPEWDAFGVVTVAAGDEREKLAKEKGLQYIGLDGSVGIIANGAGLAMSTLDTVKQVGGSAANFLDIGGGANAEVVTNALTVINTDPNLKVILINIFGGITRGDEVARGIVEGINNVQLRAPLVIRIDGTSAVEGRAILKQHESDQVISEETMLSAARRAVAIAEGK